jgi:glycosyltransferase involved in cell wall biosynthesis
MTIIILYNYAKDKQESMMRFANMLNRGYKSAGINVVKFHPPLFFAFFFSQTSSGLGKWLAYLDKWLLTPVFLLFFRLRFFYKKNLFYHIVDHSNAPYLLWLPKKKSLITCHDVLAIRGALGYQDAWCVPSRLGVYYQKWILSHLVKAENIAAVSITTLQQFKTLCANKSYKSANWRVVNNGFNNTFLRPNEEYILGRLMRENKMLKDPFLLHVGSSLPRKNRMMLLKMLLELGDAYTGNIVFAGKPLDKTLTQMIERHQLASRVIVVENPSHHLLLSLYSKCEALVFPSWSEGFGWPLIEAQACGAPVIASDIMPMPEIAGKGAIYASPHNAADFADAYLMLGNPEKRKSLIEEGYNNIERFDTTQMIRSYLSFFNNIT